MPLRRDIPALLLALAIGCAETTDEGPEAGTAAIDSLDTAVAESQVESPAEFTAVDLPAAFPSDFPIAPESRVVSATTTDDEGGAYSEIAIASQAEPGAGYQWYRQALTDAGWQISSEGQTDETRTLHAIRGESYVDLTVMPHPETPPGWVRVSASIWKAGT